MRIRILDHQSVIFRSLSPKCRRFFCIRFYATHRAKRDPYTVLNVKRGSSQEEIKAAYLDLSKKIHPDVNVNDPNAKQKFVELNEAYGELTDPRRNMQRVAGQAYYRDYQSEAWKSYDFQYSRSYRNDFFDNWSKFLEEMKKSDDPFWREFFRQNVDMKNMSYYTSSARAQKEYIQWLRKVYGDSKWYGYSDGGYRWNKGEGRTVAGEMKRAWRNVWIRIFVIVFVVKSLAAIIFSNKDKVMSRKIGNSAEYKNFTERLKQEESEDGPYLNHKDRKEKRRKRSLIEDEMKEIGYLHQSFKTKGK